MRAEGTSNSKLALWPVRWHAQRAVQQENGLSLLCERRCGSVGFSTLLARKLARGRTFAGGLTMEPPNPANAKQIYLHSPDDLVRVEILEDAMQTVPIKFHHVHFFVADTGSTNSVLAIQAWYAKTFGAKPGKRGQFEAADLPGVNLTFAKSDTPTVGTKGRELDHHGFEIKGLEAFCKKAEAAGIKLDMPYTPRPDLGIALAFVTDPWGTYIELNEGLSKL